MSKNFNILNLGNTLNCWLNYVLAIERDLILSEGTLKVPIVEYLQTTDVKKVELEYNHPSFSQRKIDIAFEENLKSNLNFIELKFIKDSSTKLSGEKQRVFNDLMRLKFNHTKGYFLICGKSDHFISSFQKISDNVNKNNKKSEGFYTEWFSFDITNKRKIIDLATQNKPYVDVYENFLDEYKNSFLKANQTNLKLPPNITTELLYLSPETIGSTYSISKVAIWEVK